MIEMMVDTEIKRLIADKVLYSDHLFDGDMLNAVGAVSYDLHSLSYANNESRSCDSCKLLPGESVFVACKEIVNLPCDVCAVIHLRNSRIRQGFTLDAPIYQPGHHTRIFFRITNVSNQAIALPAGGEFASIHFEKLNKAPNTPYSGTFQNEMDYRDMGKYTVGYKKEMRKLNEKLSSVKYLERNIYTNIITLMSIFIALFSIINVNVDLAFAETVDRVHLLIANLITIGSIAFLVSLIQMCIARKGRRSIWMGLLILSILIIAVAAFIAL